MKALSIRQPWAWLIVNGHKPVENRTWPTPHRGDLLIHAGLAFDEAGLANVLAVFPQLASVLPQRYDLGGVVGTAQLVACVEEHASRWFTGPYGFVMYDPRPITFIPCRGALSFFDVPMSGALHTALHATTPLQAEVAGQNRLF